MDKEILLGFVGLGVVGGAVRDAFATKFKTVGYDIKTSPDTKGDILKADIVFLGLPTATEKSVQNQDALRSTCQWLKDSNFKGIVVVKSTVVPGTCDDLVEKYFLDIVHNPEFLTAKTPLADFMDQPAVLLSGTLESVLKVLDVYKKLLPNIDYKLNGRYVTTEMAKYTHNLFLATKVGFMNEMYRACEKIGANYDNVIEFALSQDRIGANHTKVPNDGNFGFGGMCFPKDIQAFLTWSKQNNLELMQLNATNEANLLIRPDTSCR